MDVHAPTVENNGKINKEDASSPIVAMNLVLITMALGSH